MGEGSEQGYTEEPGKQEGEQQVGDHAVANTVCAGCVIKNDRQGKG